MTIMQRYFIALKGLYRIFSTKFHIIFCFLVARKYSTDDIPGQRDQQDIFNIIIIARFNIGI